ncbi:outer membrane protein assembly factor BamD [uncultured Cocleimonas sp.]|uniref:outer membrane protein assembly factor BamD n=1 Tax=uncultured Cocleimonas sp. TaxID=1051587 RepID=UPI0026056DA6|nr:outer membrane protein assembly factor BamD [uncultured Cocleimonas sp.]
MNTLKPSINHNNSNSIWIIAVMIFLSVMLSSCSQKKKNISAEDSKATAQQLFKDARISMDSKNYEEAIKKYEALEAKYPLGRYAQQALLEQAYAYYKYDEPDTALDTIDRYMRVYPRSPRMDYALYLRGLVNYSRGGSIIDKVFPRNFSDLDGVRQKEAFQDFSTLITRHPKSPYAVDARKRMHYLKNTLGESEVNIAKYYMKRGAYLAAFNRADYTIKHHQGTPAVIEALQIKVCASRKLGKTGLADDTMRIIKLNFPTKTKFSCLQ